MPNMGAKQTSQDVKIAFRPICPPPSVRFTDVAVDLIGRLPVSEGYNHIMVIVDRSSRNFEAVPITTSSAEEVIRGLLEGLIQRFGVPERVVTDNA